jgi:Uma2 family endonuclease
MPALARPASGERPPWDPALRRLLIEWLSQPRERAAELLGGRIVEKAMATLDHGAAQGGVFAQVFPLQGRRNPEGGPPGQAPGWWLTQDVDLFIGGEGMRPDVAGWRADRHPTPPSRVNVDEHLGVIVTPPDWVCEVLSTSTASQDLGRKWRAYQRAGVEWYWLVSVPHRSITVYRRSERSYELYDTATPGDPVRLPPFEALPFHVGPLFLPTAPPPEASP